MGSRMMTEKEVLEEMVKSLCETMAHYTRQGTFKSYDKGVQDIEDYGHLARETLRKVESLRKFTEREYGVDYGRLTGKHDF